VVSVVKRPLVAIIATGDELLPPGSDLGPDQIISSNAYGVAAAAQSSGRVRSTSASHPTARRRSPHW